MLAIPSFFLAGMVVTVLVRPLRERPRVALMRSLGVECLLLIGFSVVCLAGMPFRGPDAPVAIMALMLGMAAMGAQSALVRLLMRGVASTNVMTTNTTMLAINAAEILLAWFERRKAGPSWTLNPGYNPSAP
jgi:drug/metabolite transporter (DMT)-like permease